MAMLFGYQQFRSEGRLSHLAWDAKSLQALAIDPSASSLEEVREVIRRSNLRLQAIVDTGAGVADHLGAEALRRETGAQWIAGRKSVRASADRLVGDGDLLPCGSLSFRVYEVPGAGMDALALLLQDEGNGAGQYVFTGRTLLVGATGRISSKDADAKLLFDSLRRLETILRPDAVILPSEDYTGLLFSLMGVEQRQNFQLSIRDSVSFAEMKHGEPSSEPAACAYEGDRVPVISIQKFAAKLELRTVNERFIDVREFEEHRAERIPGVESIPLSQLIFYWKNLVGIPKIYLSCHSGRRSLMAARTLDRIGIKGVVNVSGGFQAWQNAGHPVESSPA